MEINDFRESIENNGKQTLAEKDDSRYCPPSDQVRLKTREDKTTIEKYVAYTHEGTGSPVATQTSSTFSETL